jgi:hypothetical protein
MTQQNIFIVRLPAPLQQQHLLQQQKLLAEIAYRWIAAINLLLLAIATLLVLAGA